MNMKLAANNEVCHLPAIITPDTVMRIFARRGRFTKTYCARVETFIALTSKLCSTVQHYEKFVRGKNLREQFLDCVELHEEMNQSTITFRQEK